jgi:poly(hydroxyalkanoate) granule-associated protein
MVEELDIEVHPTGASKEPPLAEMLRKLFLASIGAAAMTRDEFEGFIKRTMERGELAQKDGERLLAEVAQRLRPQRPLQRVETPGESGFEQFLNRLNIPSKRDIDDLSAKIAQLSARMEELQRSREGEGR